MAEPVRRGQEGMGAAHLHKEGGQTRIGRDAETLRHLRGLRVQMGVGRGQGVEVPVGQQGPDAQRQRRQLGKALDGPAQRQAACPADQKHLAAQAHIAHPVGELGPVVQADALQVFVPARVQRSGVLAGGEKKFLAAAQHGLFQCGEQHMPPQRRVDREQAVVFARVAAENAAAGIVAQPIGQQPFLV